MTMKNNLLRIKANLLFLLLIGFIVVACSQKVENKQGTLIFNSGFEGTTAIINQTSEGAEFAGSDNSVAPPNNWVDDIEQSPHFGIINIQYQDYDSLQSHKRKAEIVPDPTNSGRGNVLKYWIIDDNVSHNRGRIQMNGYGAEVGLKEFYQRVKFYLPSESFQPIIDDTSNVGFLTIVEIWNDNNWWPAFGDSNAYPYRMNLNIIKASGENKPLHFRATGEKQSRPCCWGEGDDKKWEVESDYELPLNTWIDMELYIKEGKGEAGKFQVALTSERGKKHMAFDITGSTCNPDDPEPDGIKYFNPIKMYTKDYITIDKCVSAGDSLKMYWDDLELWEGKRIK